MFRFVYFRRCGLGTFIGRPVSHQSVQVSLASLSLYPGEYVIYDGSN